MYRDRPRAARESDPARHPLLIETEKELVGVDDGDRSALEEEREVKVGRWEEGGEGGREGGREGLLGLSLRCLGW